MKEYMVVMKDSSDDGSDVWQVFQRYIVTIVTVKLL